MRKIKWIAIPVLLVLLIYTRFVNLPWGLPYPFHPDERNIANVIQQLQCNYQTWKDCFNPHFFAYGQFSIYLGYLLVVIGRLFSGITGDIRFEEAVIALRVISALVSLATMLISVKIVNLWEKKPAPIRYGLYLLLIFSPVLIQLAHFGTTESLLMFFYTLLIYIGLTSRNVISMGIVCGLAVGTKVSSLIFVFIPLYVILSVSECKLKPLFSKFVLFAFSFILAAAFSSPHNLLSTRDFLSSFNYESGVALGKIPVFYTRSFEETTPLLYQITHIFPYALGVPVFLLFIVSFFMLSREPKINFLRFAFLIYFIPSAFTFTKWTRFMAPVFPLMILFAIGGVFSLVQKYHAKKSARSTFLIALLVIICIVPGINFLNVYTHEDTRFQASTWIAQHVPSNAVILQDTGNAVNLPILPTPTFYMPNYQIIPFDFYHLDESVTLQSQLPQLIKQANYIIVPSRRIFKNHPANRYPLTATYYRDLFSGVLGFKQVAEFKVLDDEDAEETWTVFDHPVVRIYKRIAN